MTEPSPWIHVVGLHQGSPASQPKMHLVGLGVSLLVSYRPRPSPSVRRRRRAAGFSPVLSLSGDVDGEQDPMRGHPAITLNDEEEKEEGCVRWAKLCSFLATGSSLSSEKFV